MPLVQPPRIKIQNLKSKLDMLNTLLGIRIDVPAEMVEKTTFFHHVEEVLDNMKQMLADLTGEIIQLMELEDARREKEREPKAQ